MFIKFDVFRDYGVQKMHHALILDIRKIVGTAL